MLIVQMGYLRFPDLTGWSIREMPDRLYFNNHMCLLAVQRAFGAREIFLDQLDYQFFLKQMKCYKAIYQVNVFSFCLMPSVIYLVVGGLNGQVIACFLDLLNKTFCDFVHARDGMREHLQICRSRLVVIEDDRTLMEIVAFVDSFPVRRGIVEREEQYEWSSFRLKAFGIQNGLVEKFI